MTFLQIVTDTATAVDTATTTTGKSLNLLDLLLKGGWIMVPILLLLALAIYIFIERLLTVRKAGKIERNFMNQVQDMVASGNIQGARSLCKNMDTPLVRMLDKGLKKIGKPIDDIERALESSGKIEVYKLEKNLSILGTIAGIAPMFGFLGTIAGVITIFYDISQKGDISIGAISGGLYQKMITSAAGLVVGVIAHSAYHFLLLKIDKEIFRMESTAIEFVDLLQEPTE
ncbi:MAG: MotA/TolQ/ExbB proton channel family protein [Sphingobacteriales bacterium]|nr:MAG: MotA/TolQ/ExbB proton channel family protein [Sphingobacteriales bacterium]